MPRPRARSSSFFICDFASDLRPSRFAIEEAYERALAHRRADLTAQLDELAEPLRERGLRVTTDMSFEEPLHFAIVERVILSDADLVVKDTHYHGAIRRTLFTNTDWHLIRECPVPLLLTKHAVWRPHLKLAAALDPGHRDDKPATLDLELLRNTEYLASYLQATVSAVHVFNSAPVLASMLPAGPAISGPSYYEGDLLKNIRDSHTREFNTVLADYPAFAAHADLLDGAPAQVLPEYVAENEIDIMVLGAVARSSLQRVLIGSTAERLLDRLPCDILVIKPSRLVKDMWAKARAA